MEACPPAELATLLHDVRAILTPVWMRIHEADVLWHRSATMPSTPSQAMCRHACAFLKRVLLDADRRAGVSARSTGALSSRWKVVMGHVDPTRLPKTPSYLHRNPQHFVIMNETGAIVDITADQFGLDPHASRHWSTCFTEKPEPCDPGLATSARGWARHPEYATLLPGAAEIMASTSLLTVPGAARDACMHL